MKLETIKPKQKALECKKIKEQEFIELFINPDTKEVKEDVLYQRKCPVCNKDNAEPILKKFGLNYVRCECDMVYISPYINFEERAKWYETSKGYNWFWSEIAHKARDGRIELIWQPRLAMLKEKGCSFDSVLDVGCGSGEFLDLMIRENAGTIIGMEPNLKAVEIAKEYVGDAVVHGVFQDMNFKEGQFSLITMWEVFHHFDEPVKIMKQLFKFLKPGGQIVLQSPNFGGFDYMILEKHHHDVTYEIPNYFGILTMTNLLQQCGFSSKNIHATTPGKLDVQYVLSGVENYGQEILKDSFVKSIVEAINAGNKEVAQDLQQLLTKHKLSGSMLVVAKKD